MAQVTYDITIRCKHCKSIGVESLQHAENVSDKQIVALRKGPPIRCEGNPEVLQPPHFEGGEEWDDHFEITKRLIHTTTRSEPN